MPRKNNKTSHVLNLITNGAEPDEASEQELRKEDGGTEPEKKAAEAGAKESIPKLPAAGDKTVVVVDAQDDQISDQILDNLASQLEEAEPMQEECHIANVMENIINRTDLKKYMDQYEVCTCSRCSADVKALILTHLPAKYVVVHEEAVAPIIGFYENKFKARIFTEILKSCMQVKENPRHGL